MIHNKRSDMIRERIHMPIVKAYIKVTLDNKMGIKSLRDSTPQEQKQDIDLVATTEKGNSIPIEVKIRYALYNDGSDILLETWSKTDPPRSLGWMGPPDIEGYCKSEYLVYVWNIYNKPLFGYTLKMSELRLWWRTQNELDYPVKYADNGSYTTENRVVDVRKIPPSVFYHIDTFPYRQPLQIQQNNSKISTDDFIDFS